MTNDIIFSNETSFRDGVYKNENYIRLNGRIIGIFREGTTHIALIYPNIFIERGNLKELHDVLDKNVDKIVGMDSYSFSGREFVEW